MALLRPPMARPGAEFRLAGSGLFGGPRGRANLLLVSLRVAYAYNWFDLGPALPVLSGAFGLSPTAWGGLVAAFLLGAGATQVPSGLLARRFGTRALTLVGAALLGAAALASAFAPSFAVLVVLRGVSGAGAGLFFSPAIALVGELYPTGQRGVPVGLFSSAFSAGAGLGVFASALLIPFIGWRGALAIGGVAILVLLPLAVRSVPPTVGAPLPRRPDDRGWPDALRARGVWAIGLAFVGLEGASLSAVQYFVPFAESVHGWSAALAGGVGALFVFPSFFGGPPGGRLAERFTNRRFQMVVATAVPALLLLFLSGAGLAGTIAIAVVFSFSYGMVYAMMYVVAPYLPGVRRSEVSLAIGLFNGIQLAGGALVAQLAAVTVDRFGYATAWTVLAILVVIPLGVLAAVPRTGRGPPDETAQPSLPDPRDPTA